MVGNWWCHHCGARIPADRASWWAIDQDGDGVERQHVYCSESHAMFGCNKVHPKD